MELVASIKTVGHVIQIGVATAFLITGVAIILAALIDRLAQVLDRLRGLRHGRLDLRRGKQAEYEAEIARLSRRAQMIQWAICLCTIGALLVCVAIIALFAGAVISIDLSGATALLFMAAMLALIAGLLCFVGDITLATGNTRVTKPRLWVRAAKSRAPDPATR